MTHNLVLKDSMFLAMHWLRDVNGVNQYHWGLFITGNAPPNGTLFHATDEGKQPLDLFKQVRPVRNPLTSKSLVVLLHIGDSPGLRAIEQCAAMIPLMNPSQIPRGEGRWTCRVWVKELLKILVARGYIHMPIDIAEFERRSLETADANLDFRGRALVFDNETWMRPTEQRRSRPAVPNRNQANARIYGTKPMVIDSTGGTSDPYGYSAMDVDPTTNKPYYGSKPMMVDSW